MNPYRIRVVSQDGVEWISLDEARVYLRVDAYGSPAEHPDDDLIGKLILVARERAENYLGLSLVTKTLEIGLNSFPCAPFGVGGWPETYGIPLMYGPVQSVQSVSYLDNGVSTLYDTWQVDEFATPQRLYPASDAAWPTLVANVVNGGRVRYVVGFTHPLESPSPYPMPESIRQGMLLCIAFWYENRGDLDMGKDLDIPLAAQMLWRNNRVELSMA